ncbi:MAG: hypothetical protein H8K04_07120 [Nitrospira sp.]
MSEKNGLVRHLETRAADLEEWMAEHGSAVMRDQRHLDADSTERKYWTYGYLIALQDVLDLIAEMDILIL